MVRTEPVAANGCSERLDLDVAVVGGGVVGVLAGIRLLAKGIDFAIFERQADFGGVWATHGNNHSTLQVNRRLALDGASAQQTLCRPTLPLCGAIRLTTERACLQAPEIAYRTHPRYPLGKRGPLEQVGGNAVLSTLRRLASEKGVRAHAQFGCEVEAVHKDKADDKCASGRACACCETTHEQPSSPMPRVAVWYVP